MTGTGQEGRSDPCNRHLTKAVEETPPAGGGAAETGDMAILMTRRQSHRRLGASVAPNRSISYKFKPNDTALPMLSLLERAGLSPNEHE